MGFIYQVDPADLRFTQETVGLYFKPPYKHFSIREAVRKLSRNEMRPDHFPCIRVISYGGRLWSVDNRRLWVFRFARCSRITVVQLTRMHPRLEELIANSYMYCMMEGVDFFPQVRDRGIIDTDFDLHFPQPRSGPSLLERFNSDRTPKSRNEEAKRPMNDERDTECKEEHTVGENIGQAIWNIFRYLGRLLFGQG